MKLKQVEGIPNFYINEDSGVFYVRRMLNGRTIDKSTGQKNQKSAYRRYLEIMKQMNDDKAGWKDVKVPTFREWWSTYRAAKTKSESTWKMQDWVVEKDIFPVLGNLRLTHITRSVLERFFSKLRLRLADSTVKTIASIVGAVLQAAVDEGLLEKSPMKGIYFAPYPVRDRVLTVEEQEKLLQHLSPMHQRFLAFALGTGLRISEIQNIKPSRDINREALSVRVTGKGFMGKPRYRDVPLLDSALLAIIDAQLHDNSTNTKRHRRDRTDTLWAGHPNNFRHALEKACKAAGVVHVSPHTLRHTFATRYLQSGGNIYILSKILGHSTIRTTERTYAHLLTADVAKLSSHVKLQLPVVTSKEGKLLHFTR